MQKTSGKVVTGREIEIEEEDSDSEAAENPDYSNEDSSKNKGVSKKKKIVKSTIRKG